MNPFNVVPTRTSKIKPSLFGDVPKINGKLPAEMPIGVAFDGPIEGTEYVRISSDKGSGGHYYPTSQAWNADMTKVVIGKNNLLDCTDNYALLPNKVPLPSNRVWSNVDPDIMFGISGKRTISRFNAKTNKLTDIYKRPNNAVISFMGKPRIPDDDSVMVFLVREENTIVWIDLQTGKLLGELEWTPYGTLNEYGIFISTDHSGKWITVRPRTPKKALYRINVKTAKVDMINDGGRHADCVINTQGESVEIQTRGNSSVDVLNYDTRKHYQSPKMIEFKGDWKVYQFPCYVSGRGQMGAGRSWVVLSGEVQEGNPNHPLIMYKVDGNSKVATFKAIGGDLHSGKAPNNYGESAGKQKAVQSPDGNSVMFDSDGGVAGGELSTYILRVKGKPKSSVKVKVDVDAGVIDAATSKLQQLSSAIADVKKLASEANELVSRVGGITPSMTDKEKD